MLPSVDLLLEFPNFGPNNSTLAVRVATACGRYSSR